MTVHTTYFGGLAGLDVETDAVLAVVRRPHDFIDDVTDRNVAALAPPESLLTAYKRVEDAAETDGEPLPAKIAWESVSFEARYRRRLQNYAGANRALSKLRNRLRDGETLTLACWEKNPQWCHRRVLADVLVEPLGDVAVEHHPEPFVPEPEPRDTSLTTFGGDEA
ncbi:hypothetical protein GCM10009037_06840 [Halarchaeum grantii]|uniref:DUF488 domain-containing protein n=1 Tax=Halarchaeum grantii TaxID=1193105 RepID=A0A830ESR7_9EURY|nr:DUF488 domain-containing protein [Halarchaeum grantii]GGL25858.1 hypothetical protein GCM10009037_06840 [Halarchaeum grantii]